MKYEIPFKAISVRALLATTTVLTTAANAAAPPGLAAAISPTMLMVIPSRHMLAASDTIHNSHSRATRPECASYSPPSTVPAEIVELARALKYDPTLIFQYVHDNIQYDPIWGSEKGAWGTLLDGRGGPWDQAALLVALLTQAAAHNSAISNIQYVQGTVTTTGTQTALWLGTDQDVGSIGRVLESGGYPTVQYNPPANPVGSVVIPHVVVQASVSGTTITYDPSFKQNVFSTGIGTLQIGAAMGYTPGGSGAASLLSTLTTGSSSGPAYLQLNAGSLGNVASILAGDSQALASYITTNYPTANLQTVDFHAELTRVFH